MQPLADDPADKYQEFRDLGSSQRSSLGYRINEDAGAVTTGTGDFNQIREMTHQK